MLLIERHYLLTYAGSFTEHFYALKRARVLRVKGGEVPRAQIGSPALVRESTQLRTRDVWANLAIMVGVPYLKRKLDESYDIHVPQVAAVAGPGWANRDDLLPADATVRQRILYYYKWFLRKIYPSINAAYYLSLLAFNLAYLFDGSKYSSPFLWLVGTRIRRMGESDYRAIAKAAEAASPATRKNAGRPGQSTSLFNPRVFASVAGPQLLSSLRFLLPTSIFALKFLEWWHASDFARQLSRKAAEGLELPPPVVVASTSSRKGTTGEGAHAHPIAASSGLPILTVLPAPAEESQLCPICLTPVTTATASPYGYVYCYTCIHRWVEGTHERQERFMAGETDEEEAWRASSAETASATTEKATGSGSRQGRWENGAGRCAVSGRKVLGGTEALRRLVV